ncbi:LysR family transcriptional regulator [Serratia proteamaculans]|uniref:LysR family transcriptional regulator n=1 Tax=Serratia proteamaculans TaxID=28151 RepID=UPI0021775ED0|nr:LysR family transcriptional regulator [Serratia proteamaculans]CAI1082449.1 D-malate degradation protein R [Serratia proteamaculans]CAI1815008.1 D-malate degradation protein R [Serratia proteamaculans]CAI1852940.1 D-malate degradation protein R [Serratia proteamaculans]CAI1869374.1 D-malate degradation protein R [Serratia proteamaculans]CAI2452539.1 D-malate degradation protein R [Serratia proteamaculans]
MLGHLECFVSSAESGSFSAAGRKLGISSAAVGKNVTKLESLVGVRLFQRNTRKLTLTEEGERFLQEVSGGLLSIQCALKGLSSSGGVAAGTLKVSMGTAFGLHFVLPMLPDFLADYPAIVPDWHFDNRQVDLIGEHFDAAMGGGIELAQGMIARELAPAHGVLVASTQYLNQYPLLQQPEQLVSHAGIFIRSPQTGRVRNLPLRNADNEQRAPTMTIKMTVNEPEAAARAAEMGLGIALISMPNALPYLESGRLVRVLPGWYVDRGSVHLYFPTTKFLPTKTRVFVDFITEQFRLQKLAARFDAR